MTANFTFYFCEASFLVTVCFIHHDDFGLNLVYVFSFVSLDWLSGAVLKLLQLFPIKT